MFLIRLLLWIVTLPLVIVLYVIRFVFLILLGVGNIVAKFLGGLMFLAGILVLITGEMSVENDWDTFVATIKGMNIDRAVEIQQASYDRYLAR